MKFNLGRTIANIAGKPGLVVKQHAPEILLVTGVASIIGSTVLACRATLKIDTVFARREEKLERIEDGKAMIEDGIIEGDYSDSDYKRDLAVVWVQTAVDFVKLYGPSVTLGILGVACIIGSYGIMRKRNVALMAAYKVLEEAWGKYRKRVVDEYGEEVDYAFKNGLALKKEEVEEIDENGKKKKVTKDKLEVVDEPLRYAQWFSEETSTEWENSPDYNMAHILGQQVYANKLLNIRGYLFLNEVRELLGFPKTKDGQVVGWIKGEGDNEIRFGLEMDSDVYRDFVAGHTDRILIDFNVDGPIINKI